LININLFMVIFFFFFRTVNYCRIFTELAESLVMTMINKSLGANGLPHFSIKALELVILCANHHDYEVNRKCLKLFSNLIIN
jgi:hypothetical protein